MRSLFIGIYRLTLTFEFDLDLTNDLVKRCVSYQFILVQSLIEKYAFILFLRIFTCFEGHKYGCCDLDLWDMHMKHQIIAHVVLHICTGFEEDLTVLDFFNEFLKAF
jgi:hypothetical protein